MTDYCLELNVHRTECDDCGHSDATPENIKDSIKYHRMTKEDIDQIERDIPAIEQQLATLKQYLSLKAFW